MNKKNKVIIGVILVAILLMGIGYAALGNETLTINGTASATANQNNFQVYFTGANTVENPDAQVTATVTAKTKTAKVDITGLTTVGDSAYAILEIENGSVDINASSVEVTAEGKDTDYFDISAVMCDNSGATITDYSVAPGAKTYVKVTAELKKNATTEISTDIAVTVTAVPEVQS